MIVVTICALCKITVFDIENFKDILNAAINLSAIIIGFLAAMISIFTLTSQIPIMKKIIQFNAMQFLLNYINVTVYLAFLVTGSSIVFLALMNKTESYYWYYFLLWMFFISSFVFSTFRILYFSLKIMKEIILPSTKKDQVIKNVGANPSLKKKKRT